ncbi:MAG: type II toxin-antitoxin system RatA family toxin [Pseudomonadota bacterium]
MPTHSETKRLPYTPDQMFALVADVASYPRFIPWCAAARVKSLEPFEKGGENGQLMDADLVISFRVFRERFGSRVELFEGLRRINTEYIDGPFRYMQSTWDFEEAEGGCDVRFFVDFEFKNAVLQGLIGMVFNDAMQRIVRAFERRAAELYR